MSSEWKIIQRPIIDINTAIEKIEKKILELEERIERLERRVDKLDLGVYELWDYMKT